MFPEPGGTDRWDRREKAEIKLLNESIAEQSEMRQVECFRSYGTAAYIRTAANILRGS